MLNKLILITLVLTICSFIYSDEPTYIVTEDSPVWANDESFTKTTNILTYIERGEQVKGYFCLMDSFIDKKDAYITGIIYNDEEYQIETRALVPANTDTLFDEELILNIDDPNRKIWITSYLLDIFSKQNREVYLKYENKHLTYIKEYNEIDDYGSEDWWDELHISDSLRIFNSSISIGRLFEDDFWVLNIKEIESGYKVTVQGDKTYKEKNQKNDRYDNMQFPLYKDRKTFDLILIQDGDYMDVYIDTMDNKFATYALVEQSFLEEFENLIYDDNPDITKVTEWPKREDGSMDYPPPK